MTEVSIAVAVAAGLLSFISPCVLALLPVYLAFLGNAAVADDSGTVAATRAAVLPQALLFVTGFSVLFIVLGTVDRPPRRTALPDPGGAPGGRACS